MATTNVMTAENLQKLQDELKEIRTVKMKENSEKIKEARGQGDLSENAEYDAAKDEQAELAARMAEIEEIIKHAEVVNIDEIDTSSINLGSTVKVLDVEFDEEITYKLVPSIEADSEKEAIDKAKYEYSDGVIELTREDNYSGEQFEIDDDQEHWREAEENGSTVLQHID